MKATRILLLFGISFLVAIFAVGIYVVPKLQAGDSTTARQSDAARVPLSDVYLDVTYATPEFVKRVKLEPYLERWRGRAQPFLIGINTHVGTIAELENLQGKVLLEDSRGDRFPALGSPIVLSEHHNMYLLVFPLRDNYGKPIFDPDRKSFRLLVNGVGKMPQRVFEWKLPVVQAQSARTLASTLMLALGVVGALLVILSPCAIELTSYYAGIIAGVVSSSALSTTKSEQRTAQDTSEEPSALAASPSSLHGLRGGNDEALSLAHQRQRTAHLLPSIGRHELELQPRFERPRHAAPVREEEGAGRAMEGPVQGLKARIFSGNSLHGPRLNSERREFAARRIPPELRGHILRNLAAFVAGFTILYMASGATVALLGNRLLIIQERLQQGASLKEAICGPGEKTITTSQPVTAAVAPPSKGHSGQHAHGPGFGSWTRWANWLGAAFLVYFALKSAGVLKRGGQCFVWLGKFGRSARLGLAGVVGMFSEKRAAIIRAPAVSLKRSENITPANSFCAGLGLSVSCLTCMGGAILYPLLIFVGTSTWYWGAMILGTYSIALALPMAAIAVAVGNYTWQFASRPRLTHALQWTSAVIMIIVAGLIAFDQTRMVNTIVFSILSAFGSSPDPTMGRP